MIRLGTITSNYIIACIGFRAAEWRLLIISFLLPSTLASNYL